MSQETNQALVDEAQIRGVEPSVLAFLEQTQKDKPPTPSPGSPPTVKAGTEQVLRTSPETAEPPREPQTFEEKLTKLQAERAQREQTQGKEREAAQAQNYASQFKADPVAEIRRLARAAVGSDDEAALRAYIEHEIYTPLMIDVLQVKDTDQLDPNLKTRAEIQSLHRKYEAQKRAMEEQSKKFEEQRLEAERQFKVNQVKGNMTQWVEERRDAYPYLAVQDRPADDLFELLSDDEKMTPEKAAELANEFYRSKVADRYRGLVLGEHGIAYTSANAKGPSANGASLTNSGATAAVTAASGKPNLDDPDVSAEYWAELLEKSPEAVRRLTPRRR